jgi:hypothetical protein
MEDKLKNNNIKKAIIEVIVFFDLFDFPLTVFEIWQNLSLKCEYKEVLDALDKIDYDNDFKNIRTKEGFYFLKNRQKNIETRKKRYNYSDKKVKRAILISRIFKFIPWIKMIAVGNIIGEHNLKKGSDIDFFVITERNRLWISRFFCVLIIKLLRLRPKENNVKDKICLSYWISDESLNLKNSMLSENDKYFVYWLAGLVPIFDKGDCYNNFIKENSWISSFLPNWEKGEVNYRRNAGKGFSFFYRDVFDLFFGGLEERIRKLSIKIMPPVLKQKMNKDKRVIINNNVAKLHSEDRREIYFHKFKKNFQEITRV